MENKTTTLNPLVALGIGVGAGVCALWALLELWPVLALGGAAYLIYRGSSASRNTQEEAKPDNANVD